MRLQSAIFDMDGTLLESMHIWDDLAEKLLRSLGVEPEPGIQDKVKDMTTQEAAKYCKATYHLSQSEQELVDMTHAYVEDFYRDEVQAKPGVQKFLALLKMEGVWMYVATNTDRYLVEMALKHAGIRDYFRGILTCAEVGTGKKDSAEIYERAMTRLHSTKKDTVVFEDAVHAVRTAKKAGFRVCGVYDPSAEEDQEEICQLSDYYIRSFEELFETETL